MRGFDSRGFVFYTHYDSRKAAELESNPRGALAFYWHEQGRQVRIEGAVERTSAEESDAYFDSRPFGSRLSAIASPQSRVVATRGDAHQFGAMLSQAAWARGLGSGQGPARRCRLAELDARCRAAGIGTARLGE